LQALEPFGNNFCQSVGRHDKVIFLRNSMVKMHINQTLYIKDIIFGSWHYKFRLTIFSRNP